MQTLSLVTQRHIRATPSRVFAAWTDAAILASWWGPAGVVCIGAEVDLRVGGTYWIGNQLPDGAIVDIRGEFLEIDCPKRLVYTWHVGEPTQAPAEQVTVRFQAERNGTRVVVTHDRIASAAMRDQHLQGWQGCLDGLERHTLS